MLFNYTCIRLHIIVDGQSYILVPPDGGWGWLVLLGSTLVNMLIPGTLKSFGVLFVEFTEAFHASETAASWIPAICYFLYCSLGKYCNPIINDIMLIISTHVHYEVQIYNTILMT